MTGTADRRSSVATRHRTTVPVLVLVALVAAWLTPPALPAFGAGTADTADEADAADTADAPDTADAADEADTADAPVPPDAGAFTTSYHTAEQRHQTLPDDNRHRMPGVAAFWWSVTGYPEIAQTIRLEEDMLLETIGFGLQRASAFPDWETAPDQDLAWNHETRWSGSVGDSLVRVSIWQGDADDFGEIVDVSGLPLLTEAWVTVGIRIWNSEPGHTWIELPEPVALSAGDHLISLGVQSFGDPDVYSTYLWGRESGDRTAGGFDADVPLPEACGDYPRGADLYPQGRAYYRVMDRPFGSRIADLEQHATDEFRPHYAKILGPLPEGCSEEDRIADILNPGDLELVLLGRDEAAAGGDAEDTPFPDVAADSPFLTAIRWAVHERITDGFPDGRFHTTRPVSRQAAVAWLHRLVGPDSDDRWAQAAAEQFRDVDLDSPFATAIGWAVDEGIVQGFDDGTFRPTASVTRRAFATWLYAAAGAPEGSYDTEAAARFVDVSTDTAFAHEIGWLVAAGITSGWDDGTFRPGNDTARQAGVAQLFRFAREVLGVRGGAAGAVRSMAAGSSPA